MTWKSTIQKRKKSKSVVESNRSLAEQMLFFKDRLAHERSKLHTYSRSKATERYGPKRQKEIVRRIKKEILRLENKIKSLTEELR